MRRGWRPFLCGLRASSSRMVDSRSPRSCRISAAKHFSSRSRPSSRCSVPMCLCDEPLRLLGGIGQHALALVAERQIHRGGHLLADRGVPLDLLADGFDRGVRAQEAIGQRLVLAQQAQQQVLGLDVRSYRTGWPRSARRRSRAELFPCSVQTCSLAGKPFAGRPNVPTWTLSPCPYCLGGRQPSNLAVWRRRALTLAIRA